MPTNIMQTNNMMVVDIFKSFKNGLDVLDETSFNKFIETMKNGVSTTDALSESGIKSSKSLESYLNTVDKSEISFDGYTESVKASGTAMNFAAIKAGLLNAALNAGAMLAFSLAVKGAITLVDSLVVTLDEQKEALASANTEYENSKSELESINSELKTTNDRIDELSKKDNLTFVEQGELEKLQAVTKELLIQQDIEKDKAARAAKKLAEENQKTYRYEIGTESVDYYASQNLDKRYSSSYMAKNINQALAYKKIMEDALASGNFDGVNIDDSKIFNRDYLKKNIDEYVSIIEEGITKVNDFRKPLLELQTEGYINEEQVKELEHLTDLLETLYIQAGKEIDWKNIQFESIYNSKDFEKQKTELEELAKAGELTAETLSSNKEYNKLVTETGLSAEETANQINALNTTTQDSATTSSNATDKILSFAKALESMSNSGKLLSTLNDEIKDSGTISTSTLESIIGKYPELENVVASYLAGVASASDVYKGLKSVYDNDVSNYKLAVTEKQKDDEGFYKTVVSNLSDNVKKRAESYGIDLENYKTLTKAKQAIDAEYEQKKLDLEKAKLVQEQANKPSTSLVGGADFLENFKSQGKWAERVNETQKELDEYQKLIDAFNKEIDISLDFNFKGYEDTDKNKGNKNKFSKVFDWISIAAEKASEKAKKAISSITDQISYISKNKKIDIAVQANLDKRLSLTAIKNSYDELAKGVGLSSKYRNLVDNGALKVETITDEKLADKIDKYQQWSNAAKEVGEQIDGINDEISELRSQKLDNIKSFFDNKNSLINSKISTRESRISLKESEGKTASTSDYNYLISLQKSLISNTEKEYSAYKTLFDKQVMDGIIKKGSTEYYEGLSYLNDLTISAQEAQTAIQDLSNEKIKLSFVKFDKKMEKSSKVISEIDQALDFVDTDSIEQLTLLQTGYAKATQNVQSLNAEIVKLNKQYKNNKNDVVYKERLADLESQLSSNASAIKSYEDSIISVMKSRYDKQLDLQKKTLDEELKNIEKAKKKRLEALNAELDKFKEIIEARKKALRDEQETDNYNEEVAEYTKDISKLEARIATLKQAEQSGDMVARKERIEAEEELADKQKELAKLQKDRSVDLAEDALDEEYDAYEKMKNKQISDAESFYDLQSEQAQSIYDAKVSQLETLYENERQLIIEAAQLTQDEFSKAFEAINSTLKQYGLSVSTDLLASSSSGNSYASSTSTKGSSVANILGTQSESNKYNQDTSNLSDLNKYIASKGYKVITKKQVVELAQALGLSDIKSTDLVGNDKIGLANKERVRKALQGMIGFSDGGMVSEINKAILRNGDEALTSVKRKEIILTPSDSENFKNFVPVMNNFMNQLKPTAISNIQPVQNKNVPIVTINLPANTTISKDAVSEYRKFIPEITQAVSKEIMSGVGKR